MRNLWYFNFINLARKNCTLWWPASLKFNIGYLKMAIFEAGASFYQAHHFGYPAVRFQGGIRRKITLIHLPFTWLHTPHAETPWKKSWRSSTGSLPGKDCITSSCLMVKQKAHQKVDIVLYHICVHSNIIMYIYIYIHMGISQSRLKLVKNGQVDRTWTKV